MAYSFGKGDRSPGTPHKTKTTGTVVEKLTEATEVSRHHVAASEEEP